MPYQFVPYTILLLASAVMTSALAAYGARHRRTLGTNILGLCMAIGTLWSVANAFELSALTLEHKLFWANLQYVAYSLGPVAWLITSCQFTGRAQWIQWKNVLPLLIVPAITILLVWSDPVWGFVRTGFTLNTAGPIYVLDKQYGPWFWVHFMQSYALNFLSIFLVIQAAIKKSSIYRGQALFLFGGISLVIIFNLLYVLGLGPITDYDVTPIVFSISGGLMFWGIYRFDLFMLVPIAWDRVLEAMDTGVVVVNDHNQVVDLNPAFRRMFPAEPGISLLGMPLKDISTELATLELEPSLEAGRYLEMQRWVQGKEHYYEASVSAIRDHHGLVRGQVMVINDITELKLTQARLNLEQQEVAITVERTRFTQDLHDNLGQVLGFSSIQVGAIRREIERGNSARANEYLLRLGEVLGEAQHDMRNYVHDMRTSEYQNICMRGLLNKQLERLRESGGFKSENVFLDIADHEFQLEEKKQICNIVKEALNNVLKHSEASRVHVGLHLCGENWVLTITDNGVGFDTASAPESKQGGSGLSIMAERANLLGGKIQLISKVGCTNVRVEFPQKEGSPEDAHHDR